MTSTRFCLVILGFVVTCAAGMGNLTSGGEQNRTSSDDVVPSSMSTVDIVRSNDTDGGDIANFTTSIPSINITTNQTSTSKPSTTLQTEVKSTTPRPSAKSTTNNSNKATSDKPNVAEASSNSTGIIVLIVIIIIAAVFVAVCCWTQRRGRRYSVDATSRADDVNIPLSAAEPTDPPADPVPHNGLQSAETTSKEPEVKSDEKEEQKAEADGSAAEPSAESASPAPDSSEHKPMEAAAEQRPPAPVEPSTGEQADGEGLVCNPTTVEPLNENNSNNAATARDLKANSLFWDVPLHSPV